MVSFTKEGRPPCEPLRKEVCAVAGAGQGWAPRARAICGERLLGELLQGIDICQVLDSSTCLFVLNEGFSPKERHLKVTDGFRDACRPCLVESDTTDLGQDVYAARREPHLVDDSEPCEIGNRQAHRLNRSTEMGKRSPNAFRILRVWADPEIEISGRANVAMDCEGMCSHDQKARTLSLKKRQDVLEVPIQTGSPSSPSAVRTPERMTRTGASLRG